MNFLVEADGAIVGNVEVQDRGDKLGSSRGRCTQAGAAVATPPGRSGCWRTTRSAERRVGTNASRRRSTRATTAPCGSPLGPGCAGKAYAGSRPGWPTSRRRRRRAGPAGHRRAGDRPGGFRSILNSVLPRKRAISQLLVRDVGGRVLLCQLTYKHDWDLPGGVVEVGESPRLASGREIEEELGLTIEPGDCCSPTGCRRGAAGTTRCAGLRRRRPRPRILDAMVMRSARSRRRVLQRRAGPRAGRRLHRPPRARGPARRRERRDHLHRVRPLTPDG